MTECLEVILKNDALTGHKFREGLYQEHETVNGKRSWKSSLNAIWFLSETNKWVIGTLNKIGTDTCGLASSTGTGDYGYPNDVPNDKWEYYRSGNGWKKPTDSLDIIIKSVKESEYVVVILKTGPQTDQGSRAGIYERNITVNGRRSWKSTINANGIWFNPQNNNWVIGYLNGIGGSNCGISSDDDTGGENPYDIPSNKWKYYDSNINWKTTDNGNFIIQCIKRKISDENQKSYDNKKHLKLFKKIEEQFLQEESSDVKIICDGKTLHCHKLILDCQSDFFKGLLRHEASIQGERRKVNEIIIQETSVDTMEKILFFMYHDSIDKSKIDIDLLTAADKFLMEGLVTICVNHLKSNLTLENALDALIVAYQTNQNALLEDAFDFARKNKGKLRTDKWNEMTKNHPHLIAKCYNQVMGI